MLTFMAPLWSGQDNTVFNLKSRVDLYLMIWTMKSNLFFLAISGITTFLHNLPPSLLPSTSLSLLSSLHSFLFSLLSFVRQGLTQ